MGFIHVATFIGLGFILNGEILAHENKVAENFNSKSYAYVLSFNENKFNIHNDNAAGRYSIITFDNALTANNSQNEVFRFKFTYWPENEFKMNKIYYSHFIHFIKTIYLNVQFIKDIDHKFLLIKPINDSIKIDVFMFAINAYSAIVNKEDKKLNHIITFLTSSLQEKEKYGTFNYNSYYKHKLIYKIINLMCIDYKRPLDMKKY